jgi:hypothetical protein
MRPTAWVSFLAVFFLAAAFCNGRSTAHGRDRAPRGAEPLPFWVVDGTWKDTDEEAVQDALAKAEGKVNQYLRSQSPPMEWPIDRTYLQQKLWQNLEATDAVFAVLNWNNPETKVVNGSRTVQIETQEFQGLGRMHRAAIKVSVSEFNRNEIKQQERIYQAKRRQDRATSRQVVLARVLAGLVAVLMAVACYLRLEDATKGYYTTLLRLAAVAFVSLVGAGIWLLT